MFPRGLGVFANQHMHRPQPLLIPFSLQLPQQSATTDSMLWHQLIVCRQSCLSVILGFPTIYATSLLADPACHCPAHKQLPALL
jgi:hypothetical protein